MYSGLYRRSLIYYSDFSRPNSSNLVARCFKLLQKSGRHQRNWKLYLMMEMMNLTNSIHGFLVHLMRSSIWMSNLTRFRFWMLILMNMEGFPCKKIQFLYNPSIAAGRHILIANWFSFYSSTHALYTLPTFISCFTLILSKNSGPKLQLLLRLEDVDSPDLFDSEHMDPLSC